MFQNTMPRYEILSPDAIDVLDRGWRKIVSEIGVEFILPEAVEIFLGQDLAAVDGDDLVKTAEIATDDVDDAAADVPRGRVQLEVDRRLGVVCRQQPIAANSQAAIVIVASIQSFSNCIGLA